MNDMMIRTEGMKALVKHLGIVDAEKFIALMNKDQFDYTEWQSSLFEGMSVREIAEKARDFTAK